MRSGQCKVRLVNKMRQYSMENVVSMHPYIVPRDGTEQRPIGVLGMRQPDGAPFVSPIDDELIKLHELWHWEVVKNENNDILR